jgi:integrase
MCRRLRSRGACRPTAPSDSRRIPSGIARKKEDRRRRERRGGRSRGYGDVPSNAARRTGRQGCDGPGPRRKAHRRDSLPGVRRLRWHAFRRGLASTLFELGCDDLTVQRILRHARVNVTRERYIRLRDPKVEDAMNRLAKALGAGS